jgi:hypothetical protein
LYALSQKVKPMQLTLQDLYDMILTQVQEYLELIRE